MLCASIPHPQIKSAHLDEGGALLALHLAQVGLRKARVGKAGDAPAGSDEVAAARTLQSATCAPSARQAAGCRYMQ